MMIFLPLVPDRRLQRGAALMEVVVAISIFVLTATFVLDALSSSQIAVNEAKLEADAADLTVSVLSEVQIGQLTIESQGPTEIGETGWAWELVVTPVQDLPDYPLLKNVEIILRKQTDRYTHRFSQLIWDDPAEATGGDALP